MSLFRRSEDRRHTPGHKCNFAVLCVLLVATVLFPSPCMALPPETAVLRWAPADTPGGFPDRNDIRTPCEVNTILVASDGKTIYAIDIPNATPPPLSNPGIWKSADGGISWSPKPAQNLSRSIPAPNLPVMDIAVAPDDPNYLAAVCLNNAGTLRSEVYFSDDGGTTWFYTGIIPWVHGAGEQIGDVAISPGYGFNEVLVHDIIIGSRHPGNGIADGEIYVWCHPGFGGWKAQGFPVGDVIAVRPSPAYMEDFNLIVMSSTVQRTYISLGYHDPAASISTWNPASGWPVEMCEPSQAGANTSGEDRIITGDIALPANFTGTVAARRIIFAAYDSNGTSLGPSQVLDDVYRLNDIIVTRLRLPRAGHNARISTIAYSGDNREGKLIAGEVEADLARASARVWTCLDPLLLCPTWHLPLKLPTGGGKDGYANAQIAWSTDGLCSYCATGSGNRDTPLKWADPGNPAWNSQSLDESAISMSVDNGVSWNQTGLIDTQINRLRSVAVADDESVIYLASVNDTGFDSIWRSQSFTLGDVWQRIMCFNGESSLLRLAGDGHGGADVFWADQGTDHTRSSTDYGQTWHDILPALIIEDVAAPDSQNLYVLQANGEVRHGTFGGGWNWDRTIDTGLNTSHTIAVNDSYVLVGASINEPSPCAYSADGGHIWLKITTQTPSSGNRHVAFDSYFDTNQIIYVADDAGGIYRWSLGRSSAWDDLSPPDHSFYSIHLGDSGPLYGVFSTVNSGVDRAIYPRSGIPKPGVYWDSITIGLAPNVQFSGEPDAMDISDNTLWAIDTRPYNPATGTGRLWLFIDTLAERELQLIEPAYGTELGCDPVSGRNQEISLLWEQLSLAEAYEVEIAKDEDFNLRITEAEPVANPYYEPPAVTNPAYRILPAALPEANATYYWRVRVRQAATGQVIRSYWSEIGSFIIKAGLPVSAPHIGAQALNPAHGSIQIPISFIAFSWTPFKEATEYRFILARDSALTDIVVQENLPTTAYKYSGRLEYDTNYFWQVVATEPFSSDPSPVFSFKTIPGPIGPEDSAPLYNQLRHWLQVSVIINIIGLFILVGMMIVLRNRRA